jgi:site-specific recombinase XerD
VLENYLQKRCTIEGLRAGLFGPYLDSFVAALSRLGYTVETVRKRLHFLGAFARWLVGRSVALADLREAVIDLFLQERRAKRCYYYGHAQAARDFLDHLRGQGVVRSPEPVADASPLATLGRRFGDHLTKERGLSPVTVTQYWRLSRRFLADRFGAAPVRVGELATDDIARFLLRQARSSGPVEVKLTVTALRSFFRFLFLDGQTEVDLAAAVPSVPYWRHTELPRYLSPEQVERVIRACERVSPAALRDRAIVLLLARLGLRAKEVITLELDDVDWRAGVLKVRSKGGQHDCLPLPTDVGQAVADYLRQSRPTCVTRRLFVGANAPHRGFAHSTCLGSIVRRAINRAGLHVGHKGAHVLRHSLATSMLRSGASLDEVGEVLRHRVAPTTAMYAKVDVRSLRPLALPWPVRRSES